MDEARFSANFRWADEHGTEHQFTVRGEDRDAFIIELMSLKTDMQKLGFGPRPGTGNQPGQDASSGGATDTVQGYVIGQFLDAKTDDPRPVVFLYKRFASGDMSKFPVYRAWPEDFHLLDIPAPTVADIKWTASSGPDPATAAKLKIYHEHEMTLPVIQEVDKATGELKFRIDKDGKQWPVMKLDRDRNKPAASKQAAATPPSPGTIAASYQTGEVTAHPLWAGASKEVQQWWTMARSEVADMAHDKDKRMTGPQFEALNVHLAKISSLDVGTFVVLPGSEDATSLAEVAGSLFLDAYYGGEEMPLEFAQIVMNKTTPKGAKGINRQFDPAWTNNLGHLVALEVARLVTLSSPNPLDVQF